jgi:hypothetical protein
MNDSFGEVKVRIFIKRNHFSGKIKQKQREFDVILR